MSPLHDPDDYDVGILLVHGMGDTKPGDTLIRFIDPMLEWIKRWATADYKSNVPVTANAISRSVLSIEQLIVEQPIDTATSWLPNINRIEHTLMRSSDNTELLHTPPHSIVTFSSASDPAIEKKWITVEAWWAEEFAPPSFIDVVRWALGVAPFLLVRHFKYPQGTGEKWRQFLRYLLALCVIPLLHLIVVALLTLSTVPFLKNHVKSIVLGLIGSFGDVLSYTSSTMRSSAIRGAVERSLVWLESQPKKCRELVVIGYSLGSLIAYDILNRKETNATSFVTFGSPIKKANVLLQLQRDPRRLSLGIVLAFLGVGCVVVGIVSGLSDNPNSETAWNFTVDTSTAESWLAIASFLGALLLMCGRLALPLNIPRRYNLWVPACGVLAIGLLAVGGSPSVFDIDMMSQGWWQDLLAIVILAIVTLMTLSFGRLSRRLIFGMLESSSTRKYWYKHFTQDVTLQILVTVAVALSLADGDRHTWVIPALFASIVLFWSTTAVPGVVARNEDNLNLKLNVKESITMDWLDFWASADPFPEHGLSAFRTSADPDAPLHKVKSKAITNRRSVFRDHSIYSDNPEQFVGPLANHLLTKAGFPMYDDDTPKLLSTAQTARRSRATAGGSAFWLLVTAAVIGPFALGTEWLGNIGGRLEFLTKALDNALQLSVSSALTPTILGALAMIAAIAVYYQAVAFQTWSQWDKSTERDLFRQAKHPTQAIRTDPPTKWRRGVFYFFGIVIPSLAILESLRRLIFVIPG